MTERLYTTDQAAQLLACGKTRVYRYMKEGWLPSVKLGKSRRIRKSDLDDFIHKLADGGPMAIYKKHSPENYRKHTEGADAEGSDADDTTTPDVHTGLLGTRR